MDKLFLFLIVCAQVGAVVLVVRRLFFPTIDPEKPAGDYLITLHIPAAEFYPDHERAVTVAKKLAELLPSLGVSSEPRIIHIDYWVGPTHPFTYWESEETRKNNPPAIRRVA